MLDRETRVVMLATHQGAALFVRYTSSNDTRGNELRLPRARKGKHGCVRLCADWFEKNLRLTIDRERFVFVKEAVVRGKKRAYFSLELTDPEASALCGGSPKSYMEVHLILLDQLGKTVTLPEKERALIEALS